MMKLVMPLVGLIVFLMFAPTARAQPLECHAPLKPMRIVDLYFGGSAAGVTARRWSRFLAQEVTPRFPDGLTVVDGAGQWREAMGKRIVRERTKIVTIAVAAGEVVADRVDAVVAAYKRRFHQKSVGVIMREGCGAF
ncbi:MAG: DUF3574 domain-containing protein [Variibacter sp.]